MNKSSAWLAPWAPLSTMFLSLFFLDGRRKPIPTLTQQTVMLRTFWMATTSSVDRDTALWLLAEKKAFLSLQDRDRNW